MNNFSDGDSARFWSKVFRGSESECWLWNAGTDRDGYGHFKTGSSFQGNRKTHRANRVAFYLTYGYWPRICRHTCDTPSCCNPAHLSDGTQQDNHDDMVARGRDRQLSGIDHGNAKLTDTQVSEIRTAYATGHYSQREIGEWYGVTQTHVCNILLNRRRTQ